MTLAQVVAWERFRPPLAAAMGGHGSCTAAAGRKRAAGRKPRDEVLIFKALVVQALCSRSDEQMA